MVPRERADDVRAELRRVIDSVDAAPAAVRIEDFVYSPWFDSALETELGQAFLDCVRAALDEDPGPIGYMPGSDAKHLMGLARGDMIIFGPGSYEAAHAADEHVELADFAQTTDILLSFLRRTLYMTE